jgi:hypothetical protein
MCLPKKIGGAEQYRDIEKEDEGRSRYGVC